MTVSKTSQLKTHWLWVGFPHRLCKKDGSEANVEVPWTSKFDVHCRKHCPDDLIMVLIACFKSYLIQWFNIRFRKSFSRGTCSLQAYMHVSLPSPPTGHTRCLPLPKTGSAGGFFLLKEFFLLTVSKVLAHWEVIWFLGFLYFLSIVVRSFNIKCIEATAVVLWHYINTSELKILVTSNE